MAAFVNAYASFLDTLDASLSSTQSAEGSGKAREFFLVACMPYIVTFGTYWSFGLFFLFLQAFKASDIKPYKCQPNTSMPWPAVFDIVRNVGLQSVTVYPAAIFALTYPFIGKIPTSVARLDEDLLYPDGTLRTHNIMWMLFVYAVCSEIYFYSVHRALHHRSVYKHVHKVHHKYTSPIALEALYFHPIESILNFGTVATGPFLCQSHVVFLWIWNWFTVALICLHHCGYEAKGLLGYFDDVGCGSMSKQHDWHHEKYSANFGVTGLVDYALGTLDNNWADRPAGKFSAQVFSSGAKKVA